MDSRHPQELNSEDVEDDDMPPLADKPDPSSNYTFLLDTASPSLANMDSSQVIPSTVTIASSSSNTSTTEPIATTSSSSPSSPTTREGTQSMPSTSTGRPRSRSTRAKTKKDPDHIPRPPNAFILFRSSFIRSEQIPDKVEGNHSNLSKIIGKYWRSLPRGERQEWEAQAQAAQEKHRQEYPDWRFRPAPYGSKPKQKGGGATGTGRRRNTVIKPCEAGPSTGVTDEKSNVEVPPKSAKAKGKEKESPRSKAETDERLSKIADLLKEGKTGPQLTLAVEEWEDTNKGSATTSEMKSRMVDDRAQSTPRSSDASSKASSPDRQSATSNSVAERSPDPGYASTPSQSPSNAFLPDSMAPHAGAPAHRSSPSPPGISTVSLTRMFTQNAHHPTSPPVHSPSIADLCPPLHTNLQLAPISTTTSIRDRYPKESIRPSSMVYGFPQQSDWRPEEAVSSYDPRPSPPRDPSFWQWNPPPSELSEGSPSEKSCADTLPREMGYDTDATVMGYDSYGKDFGSSDLPSNGSEGTTWTTSPNRHGLTVVLDDPLDNPPSNLPGVYALGGCVDSSPHPADQDSMPSGFFYPTITPVTPSSNTLSSNSTSFSTLAGWAGDYSFHRDSNLRSQPVGSGSSDYDDGSKFPNSGGWYPQEMQWPTSNRQDHGMGMVLSADDWDRVDDFDPRTGS